MKKYIYLIILLSTNFSFSQQTTSAKIKAVTKNGWHKILIPSQIRSVSKENLSDFRIFDSNGIEVPYFLSNNEMVSEEFIEFPIIQKTSVPKKSTTIVFENPKKTINEVVFYINNSDANKLYSISGSNNKTDWFGLINSSMFNDLGSNVSTSSYKTIGLPLSNYKFYKIDLNDKTTLPINILKVGNFTNKSIKPKLSTINPKSTILSQNIKEKTTVIQVSFDAPQEINQVLFTFFKPEFYNRNAKIYVNRTRKSHRKFENYKQTIVAFNLNSETQNIFDVPKILDQQFFIEIQNLDNQPLQIDKIHFKQIPIFAISELKTNQNYSIEIGNQNLLKPKYDLENFKNKIPNNIPEAQIIEVKQQNKGSKEEIKKQFWQKSWFMWFCILVGGIAIAFFTSSLITDMKKNS